MKRNIGKIDDLDNLDYKISGSHKQYCCPYCESITGKKDTSYKLYFSMELNVGHCFKCNSVVISDEPASWDSIKNVFNKEDSMSIYESQSLETKWSEIIFGNEVVYKYMSRRNISDDILTFFDVRAYKESVVLSDTICGNKTRFFQLRNINSKIRYSTPRRVIKPLIWLNQYKNPSRFIICEGMISAMSAYQYTNTPSLALMGKTMTSLQLQLLKQKMLVLDIKEICCCLDGGFEKENLDLAKMLYENLNTDISIITLPKDKDPNDMDSENFIKEYNRRTIYNGVFINKI